MFPSRLKIGEIVVKRGVGTHADVERALRAQPQLRLPLASALLRLGVADEPALVAALAEHFGLPGVDLGASVLDTALLGAIPQSVARAHQLIAAGRHEEGVAVVVADPTRKDLLAEVGYATAASPQPFVGLKVRIEETVDAAYRARADGAPVWRGARAQADTAHVEVILPAPPTEGASIDVEIPGLGFEIAPSAKISPRRRARPRPMVLVVDGDPEVGELVVRALEARDLELVLGGKGADVFALVEEHEPDLLILDAMPPEVPGFEICDRVKRSRHGATPILLISAMAGGWSFAADVRRLYGADGFLAKPFPTAALVRWIEDALERTRGRARSPELEQAMKVCAHESKRAADLYKRRELGAARLAAERAVAADPFDARAHFVLGTILNAEGRVYAAIARYERVAELAPTLFVALKNLAVLYERLGFRARAVEMWTRALEQSPAEPVRKTIKAHLFGLL